MRLDLFRVHGDRPALRFVLLLLVFALTGLAFWWHFERRMASIAPAGGQRFLHDEAHILSADEARDLTRWRVLFKEGLGLNVLVLVSPSTVVLPEFPAGTLFVGAGVQGAEAVITLPPLARKALGEGQRLQAEENLRHCLGAGEKSPAPCLENTLSALWRDLGGEQ